MDLKNLVENISLAAKEALNLGNKSLVGIDIGLSSVKIAELKKSGSNYKLMNFTSINLPEGALIEDEIQDLGFTVMQFPVQRVAELVDKLSREIRREEKKAAFKRNMINKIREKGYFNS